MNRPFRSLRLLLLLTLACVLAAAREVAPATNGFDLTGSRVPAAEILGGGPPRDGIKAIDSPRFVSSAEARWVKAPNPVLAVRVGEITHIYPVHLMEYHQVVNDRFEDEPVVVTYDPLAGVPRAFRARLGGETLTFGVSGLIYNHNFLLYDRQHEGLWPQFSGVAITGPASGQALSPLRIRQETLGSVLARHPRARVLAKPEGSKIDYAVSPFERYWQTDGAIFPTKAEDRRFHLKEMVLGLRKGDRARAYLGSFVTEAGGEAEDEFAGHRIRLRFDVESSTFQWEVPDDIEVIEAYWLAWKAWVPDTEVWHDPGPGSGK